MIPHFSWRHIFPIAGLALAALSPGCRSASSLVPPGISFTHVPPRSDGSADKLDLVEGRVQGMAPGERVVLFALSGVWWVQPLAEQPFTTIQPDATWKSFIHPGSAYAALLVNAGYNPPLTTKTLPEKGGTILAEAVTDGLPGATPKTLQFSGYQWEVRQTASDHGGNRNLYSPDNAYVDGKGFLHLGVSKQGNNWVSAEVKLARSLGYGTYRFVVHDVSRLEPAAVFAMFTFDDGGPSREMDIEVSRWGEPEDKSAQFVIQPYVVPANSVRFDAPSGTVTFRMDWGPGHVSYRAVRGAGSGNRNDTVAEHTFTSGVPSAGTEKIHMNVYAYSNKRHPLDHEFEIVIEKFEFLP